MISDQSNNQVDTRLRAGSRYFLNNNLNPPQAIEIYYSNPKLIIRSGPAESRLQEVEKIEAGFKFGRLDGSPNFDKDYQHASWAYRVKIEEMLANGYVEVDEAAIYPLSTQAVRKKLLDQGLLKPYWTPVVTSELKDKWLKSSHYGGASYLKTQAYPNCQNCQNPLTHLLQLNLSEFPEQFEFPIRNGLIKVYYCIDEYGDCELFNPKQQAEKQNYFAVYVPESEIDNIIEHDEYDEYSDFGVFQPLQIIGWTRDGEEFPDKDYVSDRTLRNPILIDFTDVEKYAYTFFVSPYHSDKLGGWSQWVGFSKEAICKICSEPLVMIYHLDPEAYVEFSPAAVIGSVSICPKHRDEIFFTYEYY